MTLICSVDVGPASMLVGNLVAGKRIAQAIGRELGVVEDQDLIRKVPFATQTLKHTVTLEYSGIFTCLHTVFINVHGPCQINQ